jgi:hypothetical protein
MSGLQAALIHADPGIHAATLLRTLIELGIFS